MNARERFLAVMRGQHIDQLPDLEEEIRDDVLEEWRQQGMPASVTSENHRRFFGVDRIETIPVRFSPERGRITSKRSFKRIIRDYEEYPVKFLTAEYWQEQQEEFKGRDYPLGLIGWNGFQLPFFPYDPDDEHNEWDNLVNLYLQLKDNPEAFKDALSFVAEYYIRIIRFALSFVDADFIIISEPIASPCGPVISPRDFSDLVLPQYPKLIAAYRAMGIPVVMFSSISKVTPLLPAVTRLDFDAMRVTQTFNSGIDYVVLARQYPHLGFLGGINALTLLQNERAIVREVQRKAEALLPRGRWLPALDDTVRTNVPYRNFLAYRKALAACCQTASAA
jgi:hypothetical protein